MKWQDCERLDQSDVLRTIFYPRPDLSPDDEQTVRFQVADDIALGGRFHPAAKDAPVILLFHGNGEIAADYDTFVPLYLKIGVSLLVVDYRGYGKSGGTPTFSALLEDAVSVYRQMHKGLSDHGYEVKRLFIMGRSLGSAAAIEIAVQAGDGINGLIIESGFASGFRLMKRLGGISLAELDEDKCGLNNAGKLERVKVPTLIIHGEEDTIIPFEAGETLYRRCGSEKKTFLAIPGAGHNDLLYVAHREYFRAIEKLVSG